MKKVVFILLAVVFLSTGCTKEEATIRVLHEQGYTDVQPLGYDFFGCGEDDFFATKFIATSPSGKRVRGVVCSGIFKGNTVRFK